VTVRIAGIGGTGVVTTAHLLAWAAMLDGLEVWGLDQTGLSQKAGAVVSDLRIGAGATTRSNVIGEGEADLLLAADLMAAAQPSVLYATSAQRTAVVGSTSAVLSGPMVLGVLDRAVPVDDLRSSLTRSCRPGGALLDASAVAGRWAGTAAVANVVLLGVAAQRGLLPVAPESIEAAIGHNAVAVTANLAAFRAGRAWAAGVLTAESNHGVAADRLEAIVAGVELPAAHRSAIARLAGDLVGYQSPRLARRFLNLLGETWTAERAAGGDGELTAAVGFGYHKLLAAKDEYEVARLLLDHPASPGRTTWLLHPPLLRAFGVSRKIRLGPWARPAMAALRSARRLRGTPLDPFGRTALRRQERELPLEYAAGIHALLGTLDAASLPTAVKVARLPDRVRGYEGVKGRSIAAYRAELDAAIAAFRRRGGAED
jgi:indolepyruvate ferredoxin oxidoreductase